ncbi:MAG: glycosyltransferase family 4 protein, partial [Pseudomonadota bacterium]
VGPLDALRHSFDQGAELILTPHALAPLDDGYDPDDRRIMQTGAYNLGFAALRSSPETSTLLDWWADHMRTRCVSNLPGGLFVDQKFMDMAPAFVSHTDILRHKGYNVAYWNLHERPVALIGGQWMAGDMPLILFHFSGVDRNDPSVFSKHQNRYSAASIGAAQELLDHYQSELKFFDDDLLKDTPYAYGTFSNGVAINNAVRKVYQRQRPDASRDAADILFTFDPSFFNALSDDIPDQSGATVTRLMHEVWRGRADLRLAFNLRRSEGRKAYADWFAEHVADQESVPVQLIPNYRQPSDIPTPSDVDRSVDRDQQNGVLVAGYLRTESGLGEGVRLSFQALAEAGTKLDQHVIRAPGFTNSHEPIAVSFEQASNPIFLYLHVNADQTEQALGALPSKLICGRYRIGYWAWELPHFPQDWSGALDALDEVWVPSRFVADSIRPQTDKPVTVVPHPVLSPAGDKTRAQSSFQLHEDETVITTVFDTRSFLRRKNALGALQAFRDAFPDPDGDGVKLILKSHGPVDSPLARKFFVEAARTPGVVVKHAVFDQQAMGDLFAATDILFSPHRSEGFGLNIAQAMAAGKAVVATGWSGNVDFMDESNSILLPFSLQPLAPGDYPFAAGQHWAEPDHEAAVESLRQLVGDRTLRTRIGGRAEVRMRENFAPARIGAQARARLDSVYGELRA